MFSHVFELGDLQLLESTQFFTPDKGFSLITNFLFSDGYLNFLFNFKVSPLLYLSCLILSMFIIILIIRIIKTTCFNNTILMVELEEKFP